MSNKTTDWDGRPPRADNAYLPHVWWLMPIDATDHERDAIPAVWKSLHGSGHGSQGWVFFGDGVRYSPRHVAERYRLVGRAVRVPA